MVCGALGDVEKKFDGLHICYVLFGGSHIQVLGSTRGLNFMLVARTEVLRDVAI